ncbi:hypothetical protein NP493_272g02011 [Ridgeia piscesae]|uniref:Uncharacterized protein n=1 Tax=Ridgeia piscesae TaxID=27915 RepID=A0AAD9NXI1_RIDPI|nr:hypothetical protein NP493_272g02011 [Ridgeia piscesae]
MFTLSFFSRKAYAIDMYKIKHDINIHAWNSEPPPLYSVFSDVSNQTLNPYTDLTKHLLWLQRSNKTAIINHISKMQCSIRICLIYFNVFYTITCEGACKQYVANATTDWQ